MRFEWSSLVERCESLLIFDSPIETDGDQWKPMETDGNQWRPMDTVHGSFVTLKIESLDSDDSLGCSMVFVFHEIESLEKFQSALAMNGWWWRYFGWFALCTHWQLVSERVKSLPLVTVKVTVTQRLPGIVRCQTDPKINDLSFWRLKIGSGADLISEITIVITKTTER